MIDFQKKKKVDMSLSPENDPPNIRTKKKKHNLKIIGFFFLSFCWFPSPQPPHATTNIVTAESP